jgi:hypothetical protein
MLRHRVQIADQLEQSYVHTGDNRPQRRQVNGDADHAVHAIAGTAVIFRIYEDSAATLMLKGSGMSLL